VRGIEPHEVHGHFAELERALPFQDHYDNVVFTDVDYTWQTEQRHDDHVTVESAVGPVTVTLPNGLLYVGRDHWVTRVAGAGVINVATVSGQTLNGAASPFILAVAVGTSNVFTPVFTNAAGTTITWRVK
jgi:hypothetical protein